jgi:glyoxylase-like metal-dependent hydrolase (beta-lactamase superfamily II)
MGPTLLLHAEEPPVSPLHSAALLTLLTTALVGQPPAISTSPVSDHVHMLVGQGGNVGISVGKDGIFVIDDQFAPLTATILKAIRKLSEEPVRFVVNTHFHGDHTGGNENLGKAGAIIVAHENVRKRMSAEQFSRALKRTTPASPEGALPVVTFSEAITFHWNGDEIRVFHVEKAHTDGDSIIQFKKANVIHMGDVFFNGKYPVVDLDAGGSIDGLIAVSRQILAMVDDDVKIIPGHGPLATKADLQKYVDVLTEICGKVAALKAEGKSLDEVREAGLTKDYDATWGAGFMKPDVWMGIVYESVGAKTGR